MPSCDAIYIIYIKGTAYHKAHKWLVGKALWCFGIVALLYRAYTLIIPHVYLKYLCGVLSVLVSVPQG